MKYSFLQELEVAFPKESKLICDYISRQILRNESTPCISHKAVSAALKSWTQKEGEHVNADLYRNLYLDFKLTLIEQRCPKKAVLALCETMHNELLKEKSVHNIKLMHLYVIWTTNVKPAFEHMRLHANIALCCSRLILHTWLMLLFKEEMKDTAQGIFEGRFLGVKNSSVTEITWQLTEMLSLGIALDCLDSGISLVKDYFDQHRHAYRRPSQEYLEDDDIVSKISEYVDIHQFVEIFSPSKTAKERNSAFLLQDMSTYIAQDERSTRAFLSTLRTLMLKIRTFREIRRVYWASGFCQVQSRLIRALSRLLGAGVRSQRDVYLDPDTTLREIFNNTQKNLKDKDYVTPKKSADRVLSDVCGKEIVLSARVTASSSRPRGGGSTQKINAEESSVDQSASDLIDIFISFFGSRSAFFGKFAESLAMNVIKQVKDPLTIPFGAPSSSLSPSSALSMWSPTSRMLNKKMIWTSRTAEYDNNLHDSNLLFNIIKKRMAGSSLEECQSKLMAADCSDSLGEINWKTRFLACQQLLHDLKRTTGWQKKMLEVGPCKSTAPAKKSCDDAIFVMSKYAWPFRVEEIDDNNTNETASSSATSTTIVAGTKTVVSNIWTVDINNIPMGQETDPLDVAINSWFEPTANSATAVAKAFTDLLSQYESAHANQTLIFHGATSFVKLLMEDEHSLRTVSLDVLDAQIICVINEHSFSLKRLSAEDIASSLGLSTFGISARVESLILKQLIYKLPDNTLSLRKLDTTFRPSENAKQTQTMLLHLAESGGGSDENKGRLNSHAETATISDSLEDLSSAIIGVLRDAELAHQGIPWGMPPYTIFPEIESRLKCTVAWPDFARALFSLTQNKTLVNRGGNYFFSGRVHSPDISPKR